jgi:hypothetical protein
MAGTIDKIRRWFGRSERAVEDEVEGGEPVTTPPPGLAGSREGERSTNAQTAGAADEPWASND